MREIRTKRLLLRPFRESDYDDLFEGYPGITYAGIRHAGK